MSRHRTIIRLSAVLAVVALAKGCGDGDSPTAPPTPEPARPTTVTVSPATHELTAFGTTVQLTAEVRDQNARVMVGATVTWTSSASSVATVDASGLVTAVGNGTATITASAGSASGSAVVTVMQSVASVEVSPSVYELTALGQTVQLTAEAFDENGHAVAGAEFSWESSDVAVATVGELGLVTGAGNGEATITASAGEASSSAVVTVMQSVASIEVSPSVYELTALGETVQLTAEAFDENGHAVAGAEFSWESSDAAVATVDAGGLVTAVAEGVARITVSAGEASGSAVVTVMQPVASVEVSPSVYELTALGETVQLTAEAFDENGHAVAGAEFSWESSDAAVATVDAGGLVTAVAEGVATITASAGEASGSAVVTVMQSVASVEVSPSVYELTALGETVQLTAEAFDENGHAVAGAEFSWESSDAAVATVDAGGLVTAVAEGVATITASAGEASGSAVVTVMQPVASVEVSPSAETIGLGSTLQLTAEGLDENGDAVAGVEFSWESSDVAIATVDASGLVTGVAVGAATITASAGSGQGTAEITVMDLERAALVALYNATDGPNWVNNDNWLTDAPLGDWYGVDTDTSGRVVRLDLDGRWDSDAREYIPHGLSGPVPSELGNLANLTWLDLAHNFLSGPIPTELGSLTNLELLNLGDNDLTGPIPTELGELASLTRLYLYSNSLTGPIPTELGSLTNLELLNLGDNDLTGPIPTELGELASLTRLYLYSNSLTGPIPTELGRLADLESLRLGDNDLMGPIPTELGELASLTRLYLYSNSLTGPIPTELGRLADLESLDLGGNDLTGPIPTELGELASLTRLSLYSNSLTGAIPTELGRLADLESLYLRYNDLTGPIPESFLELEALERFHFERNADLCAPGTIDFVTWLARIETVSGPYCNESDVGVLNLLYESSGGPDWTNSSGWLETPALDEWYGVTADALGRVLTLDLSRNGLAGQLPANLSELAQITELRIAGNPDLSGHLPLSLADLSLRTFHYAGTGLCAPVGTSFRDWLSKIPSHEGTGAECPPLPDREILEVLYEATGGPDWTYNDNWLTSAPLGEWYGVEVDGQGRVVELDLADDRLRGRIPAELGDLAHVHTLNLDGNGLSGDIPSALGNLVNLRRLYLSKNDLTGAIPPEFGGIPNLLLLSLRENELTGSIPTELGNLPDLRLLRLEANRLTGQIPPELGDLTNLEILAASRNNLTGSIPGELGKLGALRRLHLGGNRLTGEIPPELGGLANLEELYLGHNELEGRIPPSFGGLTDLEELGLQGNVTLSGALPASLKNLTALETLQTEDTRLCAPSDTDFLEWLDAVPNRRVALCGGEPAMAYLVQTVQSREFPVPLIAGEKALLRAFVTAEQATDKGNPPVRVRFYTGGRETHVEDIPPAQSTAIPTEVDESSLSKSANAVIPGHVVRPGLEMVIEVDPDGTLDPGLGVAKRIPEEGRLAVDVRAMPVLDLTVIPFLWTEKPDYTILQLVGGMAADPESHEMLWQTRTLLPVGELDVKAHEPVLTTTNDTRKIIVEAAAMKVAEGGTGRYVAMISGPIVGPGGRGGIHRGAVVSIPRSDVLAHELGHNMSLSHAPCGGAGGPDPAFPDPDGLSGDWGYDFEAGRLVRPSMPDLMSYCRPRDGISGYHFSKALRYRLSDEDPPDAAVFAASAASLLLWGGADSVGTPYLEPAFVIDAPPALPDSAGEHRIAGRDASGEELFSLRFAMPDVADSDGSSFFAFALPMRSGWEGELASITLSGPGGSFALDGDTDRPMAILRNPRNGQVRGFLRDLPAADRAALAPQAGLGSLDVLFSRGIPDAAAWSR